MEEEWGEDGEEASQVQVQITRKEGSQPIMPIPEWRAKLVRRIIL